MILSLKKSLILIFCLGIIWLLAVIFLVSPLSLFQRLDHSLPEISFDRLSGGIARGKAYNTQLFIRGYYIPLGQVQWSLSASSFLHFSPCFNWQAESETINLRGNICLYLTKNKVRFVSVTGSVNAKEIAEIMAVDIKGEFTVNLDNLLISRNSINSVVADIGWQQAEFYDGQYWQPLGEFLIDVHSPEAESIYVIWSSREQKNMPLWANIKMSFNKNVLSKVSGTVEVNRSTPKGLKETLSLMGRKQNNTYNLNYP